MLYFCEIPCKHLQNKNIPPSCCFHFANHGLFELYCYTPLLAVESIICDPIMPRYFTPSFAVQNTWTRLIRYSYHHRFLSTRLHRNSIAKGLDFNLNFTSGDSGIKKRNQFHARTASYNIWI